VPDDDPFADDEPAGPPLPPEDRLWRHPSELSWARLEEPPRSPAAPAAPRLWTVALGAGVTGAVLAVSVVALTGGLDRRVTERIVEAVPTSAALPALADRRPEPPVLDAAASVVGLAVTGAGGDRAGSGVVYRDDGTVLTSAHVLEGADRVTVVLDDGTALAATVVGTDRLTDVAVVAVDDPEVDWQPAVLGSVARLSIDDPVVAVGASSATAGAVRGIGQRARKAGLVLHGLVVTDAPVTDGDAGGALCDMDGVVVGLTTVVDGVAFAVPADVARAIADDLLAGGVRHAWLGIQGGDAPGGGVRVAGIEGPAAAAGLLPGDVIVGFAGEAVGSMSDLVLALRGRAPGDVVPVEVDRAGERLSLDVTLAERP
jgi:S1-C subfamily serine protease